MPQSITQAEINVNIYHIYDKNVKIDSLFDACYNALRNGGFYREYLN
jgi:hypothetical protein